tara:strand:+ start:17518 stop:18648 length:1131 start_codon:yes stop_codon:yes gene_type:complete
MKMILNNKIKIGVLTSSRADYGIYKPLLKKLYNNRFFDLSLLVFGSHLQKKHGYTINEILKDGYGKIFKINGMPTKDDSKSISIGYSKLNYNFSKFWNSNKFDYVFVLGDRFEMSAAVQAGITYELKFIHIHGGETTLGSIDNIYRHQISLASEIFFCSSEKYKLKLQKILEKKNKIFNVGSLSLDFDKKEIPNWKLVCKNFKIPEEEFVLSTFHPETVKIQNNRIFINVINKFFEKLCQKINIVITLPNADNSGELFRKMFINLKKKYPKKIFLIKSFGKYNYFSALNNCKFLIGNSSSGIIESASFNKFCINVGNRQLGRIKNKNVFDVDFDYKKLIQISDEIFKNDYYEGSNIYYKKSSSSLIIKHLTKIIDG